MPSFRHLSRQLVLQALYAENYQPDHQGGFLGYVIDNFGLNLPDLDFVEKLYANVKQKRSDAYAIITEFAPEWPLEKISVIDKQILCIGLTEILYLKEVPTLVALNEAIELAKDFGNDSSSKFINGVLSAVIQDKLGSESLSKPQANAK